MAMFSRSTKPRPRHQPRVEALEERLALNVGAAAPAIAFPAAHHHQGRYPAAVGGLNVGTAAPANAFPAAHHHQGRYPAAVGGTNLGTVTPAAAVVHGSGDPGIAPPNSHAYGKTLTEW